MRLVNVKPEQQLQQQQRQQGHDVTMAMSSPEVIDRSSNYPKGSPEAGTVESKLNPRGFSFAGGEAAYNERVGASLRGAEERRNQLVQQPSPPTTMLN